jgi:hypothetical protein
VPDSIQKKNLLRWFNSLHAFQSDVSPINTSVKSMDLLTFANTTITTVLPSSNEQNQFILNSKTSPGFDVSISDLTNYATFEALLDYFDPLPTFVGAYLQTVAAGNYPQGSLADFLNASISAAFPGGSSGSSWKVALGLLTSAIPSVCFSATLQKAVATTVDDPSKKVSDLVNQIATLG